MFTALHVFKGITLTKDLKQVYHYSMGEAPQSIPGTLCRNNVVLRAFYYQFAFVLVKAASDFNCQWINVGSCLCDWFPQYHTYNSAISLMEYVVGQKANITRSSLTTVTTNSPVQVSLTHTHAIEHRIEKASFGYPQKELKKYHLPCRWDSWMHIRIASFYCKIHADITTWF